MSTVRVRNFSLLNATATIINATTVSQSIELSNPGTDDLMLVNNTTTVIFVRTGDSAVEADLTSMPILPGEKGAYAKGNTLGKTTHLAVIVGAGTADISVVEGTGS